VHLSLTLARALAAAALAGMPAFFWGFSSFGVFLLLGFFYIPERVSLVPATSF